VEEKPVENGKRLQMQVARAADAAPDVILGRTTRQAWSPGSAGGAQRAQYGHARSHGRRVPWARDPQIYAV
jgi:hypothetical protein